MRVLIAGGTGVIGRALIPALVEAGHEPIALARSANRASVATEAGARFVRANALDRGSLISAFTASRPDAIVKLMTAIPQQLNPKRLSAEFELTNRLRTEGTRNLLDAARGLGGVRIISQSVAFAYAPGPGLASEEAPLWSGAPRQFRPVVAALQELERLTLGARGILLRFGHLYGPGTVFAPDGSLTRQVRAGKVPIVGRGTSVFSFLHTRDAAKAVCAALDDGEPGIFNIVDDDPVEVGRWLPELAGLVSSPAPKRVPDFLARLFVGSWGVAYMTRLRGASNRRAREVLSWEPGYASWRQGFEHELSFPHPTQGEMLRAAPAA